MTEEVLVTKDMIEEMALADEEIEELVEELPEEVAGVIENLPSSVEYAEINKDDIAVFTPVSRKDDEGNSITKHFKIRIPLDAEEIESAYWNTDALTVMQIASKKILNMIRGYHRQSSTMMTDAEREARKEKAKTKVDKLGLTQRERYELAGLSEEEINKLLE